MVDFVEICNVCDRKVIIEAAKRIINSDKVCHSYSDLNFGVTFFGTQCILEHLLPVPDTRLSPYCSLIALNELSSRCLHNTHGWAFITSVSSQMLHEDSPCCKILIALSPTLAVIYWSVSTREVTDAVKAAIMRHLCTLIAANHF